MNVHFPDRDEVLAALRAVVDPEAGIDIVDLGLVYGVDIGDGRISVTMTVTSAACPTAALMVDEARMTVQAAAPAAAVEVELVWEPPWTPDRMSAAAKKKLGW